MHGGGGGAGCRQLHERDGAPTDLEKENAELKKKLEAAEEGVEERLAARCRVRQCDGARQRHEEGAAAADDIDKKKPRRVHG